MPQRGQGMRNKFLVKDIWINLNKLPMGKKLFSQAIALMVPYTGTLKAEVLELREGYCKVQLKERRLLRNHLNSVHAAALMNVSEMASGLLLNFSMDPNKQQAILVEFQIQYKKKGRGRLTSECFYNDFTFSTESKELNLESVVKNEQGEVVATSQAKWMVRTK